MPIAITAVGAETLRDANVNGIEDYFALRASGQIEESDGWIENINPVGVGFYPQNDDRVNFNRPQSVGSEYDYASSRAVYEFENVALTAVVGQIKSDVFNYGDVDGGSRDFYYENLLLKRESTSGELRLQSLGTKALEWSIGASIGEDTGRMRQYTHHGAESPQGRPEGTETTAGESDASYDYWAVFGQATWRFADQWHMVLGGRYSYEKVDTYAVSRSNGLLTGINDREVDFDDFSPRGTLGWEPAANVLAYVTASRGFKSGGTQTSNNINLSNQFECVGRQRPQGYSTGSRRSGLRARRRSSGDDRAKVIPAAVLTPRGSCHG